MSKFLETLKERVAAVESIRKDLATIEGLKAGGCVGVVKHVPGHGRAMADSHIELPVVDAGAEELESDIAPFAQLKG